MGGHTGRAIDGLCEAILRKGSPLCVGLDPDLDRIPDDFQNGSPDRVIESFCTAVIDAVAGVAPAVKPQSACFERFGACGVAAMHRVINAAKDAGLVVILDAKRGDIGVSARHYAHAASECGADWITVNPYLGMETLEPYLDLGLGIFSLVRTSNPGSDALQAASLSDGSTVAQRVGEQLSDLGAASIGAHGLSDAGAVVGLTKSGDGPALRRVMPGAMFLVPGYGAQGGTADDLRALLRDARTGAQDAGVIVNSSRGVLYPDPEPGLGVQDAIEHAARDAASRIAAVTAG